MKEPHQQRVVEEKDELDEKLAALEQFLDSAKFHEVGKDEKKRLVKQALIMAQYSDVLGERIAAF